MEGYQPLRLRGGRFAVVLALSFLTFVGRASAQQWPSQFPASGMPGQRYPGLVDAVNPQQMMAGPMTVAQPSYCPDPSGVPTAPRSEMSCRDTIRESLCGDTPADQWRPLTLGSFFTDGWRDPWVGGPAGQSGLTPRHGWLGAFEGVFYRLALVNGTYQNNVNKPFGGQAYSGNFSTFLPFSRRFELYLNVPFISTNGTLDPTRGYQSDFGDLQVAASFLLSETAAFTQLVTLGATLPTGRAETGGGQTAIFPRYSFWSNPCGAWVVRGGSGVNVPLNNSTAQTTFNGDLAIGRYFRPHDVPFGDLVFYVNSNVVVPLEGGGPTNVGVGPGTRFQITGNWWFLNYYEIQVANQKPFSFQIQAAIVKAW